MRCRITRIDVHQELMPIDVFSEDRNSSRSRMTAEVVMVGDPREAYGLMHCNDGDLEIRPADRVELKVASEEPKPHVRFDHIKKGDQVRYQFIRGAHGTYPELSGWMTVKKVEGDMIVTKYNTYEFRILRCQVFEHKAKDGKEVKPTYTASRIEDQVTLQNVLEKDNHQIASLRKQVQEFNLE